MSQKEFDSIVSSGEKEELYIFEIKKDHFVYFPPKYFYSLIDSLLAVVNVQMNQTFFTVDDVISGHNNLIKSIFINHPESISYALSLVSDYDEDSKKFSLNIKKSFKHALMNVLIIKGNYQLKEYIASVDQVN